MRQPLLILLAISFALSAASCDSSSKYRGLVLPPTPVLSVQTYYGVVDFAYIRVREEPKLDAGLVTMLRGGTIVEIVTSSSTEQTIEGKKGRWYEIQYEGRLGWVFGPYLKIFDSLDKARNAAEEGPSQMGTGR
ncbi:MAG: SH3 domain-containing protein [Spirochaetales bacterium]|nr:SH3 domain-containing protein [Spirochaetales bacterium]